MTTLKQMIQRSLNRKEASRRNARRRRINAKDIAHAVSWAKNHFNVDAPDTLLDPPVVFDMEINYDLGEIRVWPRLYGERVAPNCPTTFQLCRNGNQLVWKGTNPLTGTLLALTVSGTLTKNFGES